MTDDPESRRSKIVTLTIVGVVGAVIAAPYIIPEGKTMRRNLYRDRESCERDYSPSQCESGGGSGGGGSGGGRWRGPEYHENRGLPDAFKDSGPGRAGLSTGVETSTRGGFGRAGRFLRAVG